MTNSDDSSSGNSGDENIDRGNWTGRFDFLLSAIGYAVGLGNVWRFPYRCYKNGGGVFLIPYVFMLAFAGIPLFFMELAFGQFCSEGPLTCWKISPFFKGLGIGMVVMSALVCVYYNVIIAWTVYYLFVSFTTELPWQNCNRHWNTPLCRQLWSMEYAVGDVSVPGQLYMCTKMSTFDVKSLCDFCAGLFKNISMKDTEMMLTFGSFNNCSLPFADSTLLTQTENNTLFNVSRSFIDTRTFPTLRSASQEYWDLEVLGRSSGIGEAGHIQWKLALSLLVTWIIVFLCLCKGIKSSGKVVYFTATFPYFVLLILFFRGITLPGAGKGILWYLTPKFENLATPGIWGEAATQIFYSLGPAFGGLITMASFNKFKNDCHKDALIVSILNCGTSVFAGFVIFSVIGFMAHTLNIDDAGQVADSGPGLAFVAYPEGIAQMPFAPPLFSVLFFFMLFTLGLDSQFVSMEVVICAIVDQFPGFFRPRKTALTAVLCFIFFIIGLSHVTQGGVYVLTLFDWYSANFSLMIIAFLELVVIQWVYGFENFSDDIEMMLGFRPNLYWKICWCYLTPALILGILFFSIVQYAPATYNEYVFPGWADGLGWCLMLASLLPVFIYMLYYFCNWIGFSKLVKPDPKWGPALEEYRTGRYKGMEGVNVESDSRNDTEMDINCHVNAGFSNGNPLTDFIGENYVTHKL